MLDEDGLPEELISMKPKEPLPDECCGSGCKSCVYDIYEEELAVWQRECLKFNGKIIDDICDSKQENVISPNEYSLFQLIDIIYETKNCNLYRFAVPGNRSLGLKLGQHLVLRGKTSGHSISRQYTPVSSLHSKGYFDVIIKFYECGAMSKYVSTWTCGIKAEWRGPFGSFEYVPNSFRRLFLIAAGTGVAPMIQIIANVLENDDEETLIHLLYACKTSEDVLLKPVLNEFKRFWNFKLTYYFSQDIEASLNYGDHIHFGRIDESCLRSVLIVSPDTKILMCGSIEFSKSITTYLKNIGFSDNQVFVF